MCVDVIYRIMATRRGEDKGTTTVVMFLYSKW